ncbi:hypothetical protein [Clostridium polynesiense]|uniref:hypothetical protein n=1 Tax=Clostridium polynesiense TaxID=1325933 RepID=UPI0011CA2591|nr:hypothetical protein [Clostridium polynesiense]
MFNRDVDVNENIGDGMFCRPKDKNLTYDSIIGMLNRHYSNSFISKSKIKEDCLKIVDNKVYVLLLEGNYTGKKEFEIIKRTDNPSSINVTVNLKSESDVIASQVVLIKESGSWKVESGSIFPSRELLYKK